MRLPATGLKIVVSGRPGLGRHLTLSGYKRKLSASY
jgi:hypothetical protein